MTTRWIIGLTACALLALPLCLPSASQAGAQPARPLRTDASIVGRVIDGSTNAPVSNVTVTLAGPKIEPPRLEGAVVYVVDDASSALATAASLGPLGRPTHIRTDSQGRFAFTDLPPGAYGIMAAANQYVTGRFGATRAEGSGRSLDLAPGQRAGATIAIWRNPVVSGRVVDEAGEPLVGAELRLLRWDLAAGRRKLQAASASRTNEYGEFSISAAPGEYLLAARTDQTLPMAWTNPDEIRLRGVRPTFYPGAPIESAEVLRLSAGDRRTDLVMRLRLEPMVRLAGQLRNPVGAGPLPTQAILTALDGIEDRRGTAVDKAGRFIFDRLFPGEYLLDATSSRGVSPTTAPKLWAKALVQVGDQDGEVTVDLRQGLVVRGRLQFEGGGAPSGGLLRQFNIFMLSPEWVGYGDVVPPHAVVEADGTFAFQLESGRYLASIENCCRLALNEPQLSPDVAASLRQWRPRSAMANGKDILDVPLDLVSDVSNVVVTFTRESARVTGQVTPDRGGAEPVLVVLIPSDESLRVDFGQGRRLQATQPSRNGRFTLNVPPGDYMLAAIRGVREEEWRDADFLHLVAQRATRASLREGSAFEQNLTAFEISPRNVERRTSVATARDASLAVTRPVAASTLPLPTSTGAVVIGRVVAQNTSEPLAGVRVASSTFTAALAVYTDDTGRFVLRGVGQGRQTVYTSKPGWAPTPYRGSAGTRVMVSDPGDRVENVTVTMAPAAGMTGTVFDHEGRPTAGAGVAVWQYVPPERRTSPTTPVAVMRATTDARGQYRIHSLSAGRYLVSAAPPDTEAVNTVRVTTQEDIDRAAGTRLQPTIQTTPRFVTHAPVFYPATTDPLRAEPITITAGDWRVIDFELRRVELSRIEGILRMPDGSVPGAFYARLEPFDPIMRSFRSQPTAVESKLDGTFSVSNLLPGRYRLAATVNNRTQRPEGIAAYTEIIVNEVDQTNVVLNLLPGATISGRVVLDAQAPGNPDLTVNAYALTTPIDSAQSQSARVEADGSFTLANVLPGSYRLSVQRRTGGTQPTVVAQTVDGRNTLDGGLEVRPGQGVTGVELLTTSAPAEMTGVVRSEDGRPSLNADVVLFPADQSAWHLRSGRIFATQTDRNGRYTFRNVPPGEYRIAVAPDMGTDDWRDPALLVRLQPASRAAVLRAGPLVTLDLTGP